MKLKFYFEEIVVAGLIVFCTGVAFYSYSKYRLGSNEISFFYPTHFDFGERFQTQSWEESVLFINKTDQVVSVDRVETSCGCTLVNKPVVDLLPNEQTQLIIKLNLNGKRGKFQEHIVVDYTCKKTRKKSFKIFPISGNVVPAISISPTIATFSSANCYSALVRLDSSKEFKINKAFCTSNFVDTNILENEKAIKLTYIKQDGETKSGSFCELIIETSLEEDSLIRVPVVFK